jgi:hypothetical protein
VKESNWWQAAIGDWEYGEYVSFGLLQVKKTAHPGTFPAARDSTALNLDYALAFRRVCYEGWMSWLYQVQPGVNYASGDEWGCIGLWFSGRWYHPMSESYLADVRAHLEQRSWRQRWFLRQTTPPRG